MFISYFDECGDDGYPEFSSQLFVLSNIYMHHSTWKQNYDTILAFRKQLKLDFNFPVKQEFHTKEFVTDKNPYHGIYSQTMRRDIMLAFASFIAKLEVKAISVVIDKNKINRASYDVLKNALKYNVQRIENDLSYLGADAKFIIITDEGRSGKMTKTTREIQKINYIPSMFGSDAYRKEIKLLIEDPLPKKSSESFFIQVADFIAYVVTLYAKRSLCKPQIDWNKRTRGVLNYGDEIIMLNAMKTRLNCKASRKNEFGIVYYPT